MRAERKPPQRAEPPALLALRHSLNVSAAFAKHDPARGPPHGRAGVENLRRKRRRSATRFRRLALERFYSFQSRL